MQTLKIVLGRTEDSDRLFGNGAPTTGLDIRVSMRRFDAVLLTMVRSAFPDADVSLGSQTTVYDQQAERFVEADETDPRHIWQRITDIADRLLSTTVWHAPALGGPPRQETPPTAPERATGRWKPDTSPVLHAQKIRSLMRKWSQFTVEQEQAARNDAARREMGRPPATSIWHAENLEREIRSLGRMIEDALRERREAGL